MGADLCDRCTHFRPKRRLEDLLKLTTDPVSPAVREIREREEQWEEEESQTIIGLLFAGEERWPGRSPPRVLSYCGLEEEHGKYLIHEGKNAGERCEDFAPSTDIPLGFCSTCAHRKEPPGPKRDHEDGEAIIRMSRDMGGFRGDTYDSGWGTIKQTLSDRSERIDAQKSADMLRALDSGGEMPTTPGYYESCKRYSGGGRYVLCRVRNYHGRCPDHSDRGKQPSTQQGAGGKPKARRWNDGGGF